MQTLKATEGFSLVLLLDQGIELLMDGGILSFHLDLLLNEV